MANKNTFLFELGQEVQDVVTKFKGTITYRVEFLTGCNQYGLQPPMNDKGEISPEKQVDENRLLVVGDILQLPIPKPAVPGGPNSIVKTSKSIK